MFILYNNETKEFETFSISEMLEMVNRDRSNEWSPYDQNSTIKELAEIINDMCQPYEVCDDMPFRVQVND